MENSSKALYMAGSLLIAIMIISVMVYAFNNLGILQNEKDKIEYEESITAFNKEYEAFNNKIMYGTTVISCINKAISNDQKYVKKTPGDLGSEGKWTQGNGNSREDALVNVKVLLKEENDGKKYLYENVEVYSFDKAKIRFTDAEKYNPDNVNEVVKWNSILNLSNRLPKFSVIKDWYGDDVTLYEVLTSQGNKIEVDDDCLELLAIKEDSTIEFNDDIISLYTLMKNATEYELIIQNPDTTIKYENPQKYESPKNGGWSYIKWTTCLADFKRRKFTCDDIKYNENTGRVSEIVFKEYED